MEIFFTFLEIYNEKIIDLLDVNNMDKNFQNLKELTIYPSSEGIIKIKNLTMMQTRSIENVFENYLRGNYIRKVF